MVKYTSTNSTNTKTSENTGLSRNDTHDKFYTKSSTVDLCIEVVKQHVTIKPTDLILEPCAGSGAFVQEIKTLSENCRFYDIDPYLGPDHQETEIVKQDFFTLDYQPFMHEYSEIHVMGNPPFGRQSGLARQFIKRSCLFAKTVSYVLPKSFKKESMRNTFPIEFHLIAEIDLPEHSFVIDGQSHDVPCVFQIWEKRDGIPRHLLHTDDPQQFQFVKKNAELAPDISLRRVGVNAGAVSTDIANKSEQSHYFIRFHDRDRTHLDGIVQRISNIPFANNNTVGPRSISKPEVIREFNARL